MKSIWNGSISFGLVSIPIKLYSATESKNAVKTRLLHKEKLSPIRYKKWCDACKKEVDWKDIVKGFEVGKNEFVVIDEKELESFTPEKTQRIDVVEFVDAGIDPVYFNSHYFIGPEKEKDKTYFLFKEVLQRTAKIAIGKFVMRNKEHICAIASYKEGIILTTLNYAYEIRDMKKVPNLGQKPKLSPQEVDLAKQLIDRIYEDQFDITRFKDTFREDLLKILKKKEKGEEIVQPKKSSVTKEKNLVEALKASLK